MKPNTVGHVDGPQPAARHSNTSQGLLGRSIVLTLNGEMAAEDLVAGDRVITRDSGAVVIQAIHRRSICGLLIHLSAGALGDDRPSRDTAIPAGLMVLIRDWRARVRTGRAQALVRAEKLIDGEFVRSEENPEIILYQIEFARPHVIYADGLEVMSWTPVMIPA